MSVVYKNSHKIDNVLIPYSIHLEYRKTVRNGVARTKATLRLPHNFGNKNINKYHQLFLEWLEKEYYKNPEAFSRFVTSIKRVDNIIIYDQNYLLKYSDKPTETLYQGKIDKVRKELYFRLPKHPERQIFQSLVSDIIKDHFIFEIIQETDEVNKKHFNFNYRNVSLRYSKGRWGSCSSQSTLNFSTKLLLTPKEVRQYVIIHELAHLRELNHSKKFWSLVETACPNYQQHEQWLKNNSSSLLL